VFVICKYNKTKTLKLKSTKMKNQELKKPFFANFLENQLTQGESNEVQGGALTSKLNDGDHTLKFPSDSDDDTTNPISDNVHTMKYPSDNDESGPLDEI
jgi:hypothetical protein